jgi:hypothetical protein
MTKKSLALLVFLLMALHFLLGEASAQEGEKFGRYQIVINPSMRADTFLLDTQSGKIWRLEKFLELNGEPTIWVLMDRFDGVDLAGIARKYGVRAKSKSAPN